MPPETYNMSLMPPTRLSRKMWLLSVIKLKLPNSRQRHQVIIYTPQKNYLIKTSGTRTLYVHWYMQGLSILHVSIESPWSMGCISCISVASLKVRRQI